MRVLIVEDDSLLGVAVAEALRRSGYATDWVDNVPVAQKAAKEEAYDAILLDLGLPGPDGTHLLNERRELKGNPAIIVLSARDAIESRVRCLDLGADDFVPKPFALPELEARIRAVVRRVEARREAVIKLGDIEVDMAGKRVRVHGEPIDLTAREWSAFHYLVLHVGQIVSKEQLMHTLCSWDDSLSENAIEVYVSRVRLKLQGSRVNIRSVRGFGYLLEELPEATEETAREPAKTVTAKV